MKTKAVKSNKDKVKILSSNLFPVVGVGASAGGLDAFKQLLKAVPENSGMAYILVQHLDPAHDSILAEILQKITRIPVQEITNNIQVEADHIYIIPSNKLLTATDGVLQLSARLPKSQRNLPIDVFFTSLAEVHQNHAIGIVLSGTASDGTLGLKAIKEHGGITFAQSRDSAAYEGMPQSAIEAGVVDYILSPDQIPQQLLEVNKSFNNGSGNGAPNRIYNPDEKFRQIISILRIRRGVDFTYYKQTTIRRRITRRMALCMKSDLGEYLDYLKDNNSEQDILFQDLLIPVTQFFRDPKVFETLAETVFPALMKDRQGNDPIRVWIPGCSTGEEAYSIMMSFQEYLGDKATTVKMQIFATDISELAITKARTGQYSKNETASLSSSRLQQFFTKTDGAYRLNKNLRDCCVFACHNYLKDPPFAKIDMISCRNSLIYLEPFLQKKALTTFHYALKEKGFLLLGKSETTAQSLELFNTFDKSNKFYTRKPVKGNFLHVLGDRINPVLRNGQHTLITPEINKDDFQKSGDELLLSRFVPPGVIVNDLMDIVQVRGSTGPWLEFSSGTPSLNVLKMAREGLAFELRNALHKAKKQKTAVVKSNITVKYAGNEQLLTIEVIPLPHTIELYFLILFKHVPIEPEVKFPKPSGKGKPERFDIKLRQSLSRNQHLQKELAQVREDMKTLTEDQEAANEELQSANEELLSGSEELQSLNEELETSKEEVQTSNEELVIVNQELYDRNDQLNASRLFAESIVSTIREPILVLSRELKVKSANKSFYEKFHASPEGTEGKLLFDLAGKQWNIPGLREMLEKMLPHEIRIADFEVTHDFPGLGERTMLFNATQIITEHQDEQSILIAIEDVTEKRKVEREAKLFEETLEKKILDRTFELQEVHNDLQLTNESLEQFAYIASHDLQEPLRKIRTFAAILRDRHLQDLPESVQELVDKINTSSERMSSLISELLNFSRVLHSDAIFKRTDLDDMLSRVLIDFDLLINEKGALIEREPLPVIDAIPFQINQLFYQLIGNAIKFSKDSTPPVLKIGSRILSVGEEANIAGINPKFSYCEISIKDNGIGFQQKFADQIFLVFHRLHNHSKYSCTGIGLALCKTIVANHHGHISVASKEKKGTEFKILLPLTR